MDFISLAVLMKFYIRLKNDKQTQLKQDNRLVSRGNL